VDVPPVPGALLVNVGDVLKVNTPIGKITLQAFSVTWKYLTIFFLGKIITACIEQ
jgi:hypothetical protein